MTSKETTSGAALLADLAESMDTISTAELIRKYPPGQSERKPWTWDDEARDIDTRTCCCCGQPGHYQRMLEAHIAQHGLDGLAIHVRGGRVRDGHHRVVAARRLGIERLPLETKADAKARWIRDHGYVGWDDRRFGDR